MRKNLQAQIDRTIMTYNIIFAVPGKCLLMMNYVVNGLQLEG
jgi:hypothetical protein